ncbi:hypothetical protein [Shewanella sp.]|uniref:hypothetical protein n=1 Tax=Shewanella sp. TaxID=50422 RepID=UPI00404833BA
MAEGKYWCFTDFTLKTDYGALDAKYLIYGVETCPDSGKVHHQGYCEFPTNRKLNRLKKFDTTIHWERRQGNQDQAIDYSKKEGDWHEFGEKITTNQGSRNDIKLAKQLVKDGAGMARIIDECTSYQAIRMAELSLKYNEKKRDWLPDVVWLYGPTGTGKTRRAVEECGGDYWMSGRNLKWWEGYDAHENIIIDDFRKDFCTFHELLRILDRYPYRLEVKGTSRQLLAKKIFITSCFHPRDVYDTREDIEQLIRRISSIINLNQSEIETEI